MKPAPSDGTALPPKPGRWRSAGGSRMSVRRQTSKSRLLAKPTAVLAIVLLAASSATSSTDIDAGDLPSPLAGPGVAELKKSQIKKIDRGWRELATGDTDAARKRAQRAGGVPPATLLEYQASLVERGTDVVDSLGEFCDRHPGYAAAWVTMSVAAEHAGLEMTALETARRGAALWSTSSWARRPDDLYRRWVDDRIFRAEQLIGDGRSSEAMVELDAAGALDPTRQDALLSMAKIFISNDQVPRAEEILDEITELPEARYLQGTIAEDRLDWQAAMDSYSALPPDYPGRTKALERAKTRWRLTLLPSYARSAMNAAHVTRGELAVILVSVQPRLETLPGGSVPVMSDIVDAEGQREIITVVRLGIMNSDRRDRLFFPQSPADVDTVRGTVDRARSLLGLPALTWCEKADMVGSVCTSISSPPSGNDVVHAMLDSMSGENR
jgi:hypothetical protein